MRIHNNYAPPRSRTDERGFALLLVFILVIMLGVVVAALSVTAWHERVQVVRQENEIKAGYAADAGVALAENQLWNAFLRDPGTVNQTLDEYLAFLGTIGINNDDNGQFASDAEGVPTEGTWLQDRSPANVLTFDGRARLAGFNVWRSDFPDIGGVPPYGTLLRITSFGAGQEQTNIGQEITQIVSVAPRLDPLDYAALMNNATCAVMCHTQVDNAGRYYNAQAGSTANYNTYAKVMVGSLEETAFRLHDDRGRLPKTGTSHIAGTFLSRGLLLNRSDESGGTVERMTPDGFKDIVTVYAEAYAVDAGTGVIQETAIGELTPDSFNPMDASAGPIDEYANLYENYPNDPDAAAGYLPDEVPEVFPNGVSPAALQSFAGVLAAQGGLQAPGTLSGGNIYTVSKGGSYSGSQMPSSGNISQIDMAADATNGAYVGNLILRGTDANPIQIDSTIIVDGDVVLTGTYTGTGQIYATGNIYIVGDLEQGGTDEYLLPADQRQNGLLLRANGNILVNDFLTPAVWGQEKGSSLEDFSDNANVFDAGGLVANEYVNPSNADEIWSFSAEQMALFNRSEWQKTQQYLPGPNGTLISNSTFDLNYQPVYFRMNDYVPVHIFAGQYQQIDDGSGRGDPYTRGSYWNDAEGYWEGDFRPWGVYGVSEDRNGNGVQDPGEFDYDGDGFETTPEGDLMAYRVEDLPAGARVKNLAPTGEWLGHRTLKKFWLQMHDQRANGPLQIDAGLQSSGAIILEARSRPTFEDSKYDGQVIVNGLMVARHVGVHAPGKSAGAGASPVGLQLNYDQWLRAFSSRNNRDLPVELRRVYSTAGRRRG